MFIFLSENGHFCKNQRKFGLNYHETFTFVKIFSSQFSTKQLDSRIVFLGQMLQFQSLKRTSIGPQYHNENGFKIISKVSFKKIYECIWPFISLILIWKVCKARSMLKIFPLIPSKNPVAWENRDNLKPSISSHSKQNIRNAL